MKSKRIMLLKTMLLSTSQINILKYSKDKKRRGRAIGSLVGMAILFAVIMMYCIFSCAGFGMLGFSKYIPMMNAIILSTVSFLFTILKTNGYLFNFKEYDMIISLPFEPREVAADKFLYMYIKSLPWYLCISLSMLVGYAMFERPAIITYFMWLLLTFAVPLIPTLLAALLGVLIARISVGFKKTNLVQTILVFILMLFCFSVRYIIEAVAKNGQAQDILNSLSQNFESAGNIYFPIKWFSNAILRTGISDALLLMGVSILLFELMFVLVGRSYRQINTALKTHVATRSFKMDSQKVKSPVWTIAFKEFRRFMGSTVYMTNAGMGEVLAFILGIVVLVIGFDKLIGIVTNGAPFSADILNPAIPLIVYFLIGMISTTTCSPSLEGKNYWIIQSLPIKNTDLYKGKMLFNMCLMVPFFTFTTLCFSISAGVGVFDTIMFIIEGIILCGFSTTWGLICGIKHIKLEWENEVEVIKQGLAVLIYMLPNMIITMGLVVLVAFLGQIIGTLVVTLIIMAVYAILTLICYRWVMRTPNKLC